MPIYTVKEALSHDGKDYPPEESIEMGAEMAASLIAAGVLSAEAGLPVDGSPKPSELDALYAEIRESIASLDASDPSAWTQSGKAKTEAIEVVLGYHITASERDDAMATA